MSRKKRSKIWTLSTEDFRKLIATKSSFRDVLRELGINAGSNNSRAALKQRMYEEDISYTHFSSRKLQNLNNDRYTLEELLINNCEIPRSTVKRRLIEDNIIPYECALCDCPPIWNGKSLVLVLDHVNGINNDNRKENLRFLCPNCNSQTDTFTGKNIVFQKNFCACGAVIKKQSKKCPTCHLQQLHSKEAHGSCRTDMSTM